MIGEQSLTQESFEILLSWLDPERETAGRKYETIRCRLIKIFERRNCSDPETLADETINRVCFKIKDVATHYEGNPALYFYGVAQKIYLESLRQKPSLDLDSVKVAVSPDEENRDESDQRHQCLNKCLATLPADEQEIVFEYYAAEKQLKIDSRQKLAERFGLTLINLRVRAFRIRQRLRKCVENCLQTQIN